MFSFLLAIPAIGGASLLEILDIVGGEPFRQASRSLALGAVVLFSSVSLRLWWLTKWLEAGRLEYFGYWCLLVGTGVLIWQLVA